MAKNKNKSNAKQDSVAKPEKKLNPAMKSRLRKSSIQTNALKSIEQTNNSMFENTVLKQLGEILNRLNSIEDGLDELKTSVVDLKDGQNIETIIGTVDPAELDRLNLPVINQFELQMLNKRLETPEYFDDLVYFKIRCVYLIVDVRYFMFQINTLNIIGGNSGKANGDKVVPHVTYAIISQDFLSQITWTGRAGKGMGKKVSLEKYQNIIRAIFTLCQKADQRYTLEKCRKSVIYKVIKYAYTVKPAENETTTNAIVSTEVTNVPLNWKKKKATQYQQSDTTGFIDLPSHANEWRQEGHAANSYDHQENSYSPISDTPTDLSNKQDAPAEYTYNYTHLYDTGTQATSLCAEQYVNDNRRLTGTAASRKLYYYNL